jgi:sec-independent protein translocase protein TatA
MGDLFQPTHLLIIAIVLLVLFGARRLPELGKGLGEGLKGFKEGLKGIGDSAPAAQQTPVAASTQNTAPAGNTASYRCPSCKALVTASAPNPNASEDKGFCPECGTRFDKKTSLV